MGWRFAETPEQVTLTVTTAQPPTAGTLWVARAAVQDFRPATWTPAPLASAGAGLSGEVARAQGQYTAVYGELVFSVDGQDLYVSTQPRILAPLAQ